MKQKIIRIISSILCVFVLLGNISVAHGTQDIDISEKLSYTEFERIEGSNYSMSRTKTQSKKSGVIMTPLLIVFVHETPDFFGKIKTVAFVGTEVDIIEELYWFYLVEVNGAEGYIFRMWLSKDKEEKPEEPAEKPEIPEQVNAEFNITYDHVYVNKTNVSGTTGKPRAKLLYTGSGEVVYSASNTKIISVDSKTGLITGKKPGTAYLIASVDGTEKDRIPVYCIYEWEQGWTGKANKSTKIYTGTSASTASLGTLPSGASFSVGGDDGGSAGWAYGKGIVEGKERWGFVKINDISTKGTVSQYTGLQWSWPVKTPTDKSYANYIQSPYGKRNTDPTKHKGIDITTGTTGGICGYPIVSAFSGTVDYICEKTSLDWGYCASIISDDETSDFVSGKQYVAIYMHMLNKPKVSRGQEVSQGKEIGFVGSTGRSYGYHLHFEVNNQTASIYESNGEEASYAGRSSYNDLINPVFFYMDDNIRYNETSDAELYYYGTFWYGSE